MLIKLGNKYVIFLSSPQLRNFRTLLTYRQIYS